MSRRFISILLTVVMTTYPLLAASGCKAAETGNADNGAATSDASNGTTQADDNLTAEQIDNLLAPIALYPDPLLAQILPASTFVDDVDAAARYLRANNNKADKVEGESWDVSVKSVAHYPTVVFMMADKIDWTTALGHAWVLQSNDVLDSVQRLRGRANEAGNLETTPQQTVIVEKEVIKIVPAQPQVIYVPTYSPEVVYVKSGPSTGTVIAATVIAFGAGLAIGAWLNNDCDWYGRRVYYHGWRGTGWVGRSSVNIRITNNYYVNNRYTNVNINRRVLTRPVRYNNVRVYNKVNRNVNYNNVRVNNRARNNVNNNNRSNINVNNKNLQRNIQTGGRDLDSYRGKQNTPSTRPAQRPDRSAPTTRPAQRPDRSAPTTRPAQRPDRSAPTTRPAQRPDRSAPSSRPAPRPATKQPRSTAFGGGSNTRSESQRGKTSRTQTRSAPTRSQPTQRQRTKRN